MEIYKIVKPVTNIVNQSGDDVPGVYNIQAVPLTNTGNTIRANPTYENVANLDSGIKIKPEIGTCFLGEIVHNTLYIIKYLDSTSPALAEVSKDFPKYKKIGESNSPGEFVFKTPSQSLFALLRNGVIKIISSMGAFLYLDPYFPGRGIPQLLDKLFITIKNFILNIYGGKISWTNFEEDDKWKSEFAMDLYRGDSISRDEDDVVKLRVGSPTENKERIITLNIRHKDDTGKISNHVLKIGKDIQLDSEFVGDKTTTHTLTVGDGVSLITNFEQKYKHTIEMKKDIRIQTENDESKVFVGTNNATAQPLATEYFVKQVYNQHKHPETGAMTGPPIPIAIIVPKDSKTGPTTFTTQGD